MIDHLVARYTHIRDEPAWSGASRAELEAHLSPAPPEAGVGLDTALQHLIEHVLPFNARIDHPRFLAFVPGSPVWPAVMGDLLAAGSNIFQGTWLGGAGASAVELTVIEWFRQWLGLPASTAGLLVSGGSAANLTAIACARARRFPAHDDDAVIYCSAETHSSVFRAASVLGFAPERVRHIRVDAHDRIDPGHLEASIVEDARGGLRPFLVVANGGTTSSGAVDPLDTLADMCARHALWLHVDAAYGGFAVLTERGKAALEGIGRADSVTLDPHKWLYQTFEAGCLLVRDGALLDRAFAVMPPYLQDTAVPEPSPDAPDGATRLPVNFANRGVQLTRSARALKIWLSLQAFGTTAFAAAIDECMDIALYAEQRIRDSGHLELVAPARLGIVCFVRRAPDAAGAEAFNATLLRALLDSGTAMISSTRVQGAFALRLCVLNYRTTRDDVDAILDWIERYGA
ncbi:MAG TPA: aminotransferase class V-fold PLP-dependent enzyme [Longimicrobiales bacterium]|nr:aminotransferase class V-fold PLP-dependent enzyme [Longimicrobiales bacterium]